MKVLRVWYSYLHCVQNDRKRGFLLRVIGSMGACVMFFAGFCCRCEEKVVSLRCTLEA